MIPNMARNTTVGEDGSLRSLFFLFPAHHHSLSDINTLNETDPKFCSSASYDRTSMLTESELVRPWTTNLRTFSSLESAEPKKLCPLCCLQQAPSGVAANPSDPAGMTSCLSQDRASTDCQFLSNSSNQDLFFASSKNSVDALLSLASDKLWNWPPSFLSLSNASASNAQTHSVLGRNIEPVLSPAPMQRQESFPFILGVQPPPEQAAMSKRKLYSLAADSSYVQANQSRSLPPVKPRALISSSQEESIPCGTSFQLFSQSTLSDVSTEIPFAFFSTILNRAQTIDNTNIESVKQQQLLADDQQDSVGCSLKRKKQAKMKQLQRSTGIHCYESIIDVGVSAETNNGDDVRSYSTYISFFQSNVEVYKAQSDPSQQLLFRTSDIAHHFKCSPSMLSMYFKRRKQRLNSGIFQALGFLHREPRCSSIKVGSYFASLPACLELERYLESRKPAPIHWMPRESDLASSAH